VSLSVIIPSRTASNLIPCVESVRKHEPNARVIVVDDGLDLSAADAAAPVHGHCWLCSMDPAQRIPGVKPFVYARNVNLGINRTRGVVDVRRMRDPGPRYTAGPFEDDVVLLNDDALLKTPGGFSLLQRAAEENPEYGVIAATCNNVGNRNQCPQGIGLRADPRIVCFIAVLIPRRTIDLVGLLDERFVGYGFEDDDYCLRVRRAGLKIGIHDGCYVDHGSLKSTFRGNPAAPADLSLGMKIFINKWGVHPL
jgi:glycosyltransferase involved in cell wall biosynthesis